MFNDHTLDGVRQAGASGLREIAVVIQGEDAIEHRIVTDAAGEFEVDDLAPGRYRVSIEGGTLPANYVSTAASIDVKVAPSATATVSMPVRALRSIDGRVYLGAAFAGQPGERPPGFRAGSAEGRKIGRAQFGGRHR